MSSVCTWQFHRPSPPTTTIESPSDAHADLNVGCGLARVEEVHDLVAEVGQAAAPTTIARVGVGLDPHVRVDLLGRRHRALVDHVEARREQELEAAAAGVDDARLPQHRQ